MRTLLKEYKEISLKLLYELKKDNLNEVFKLTEERQQILYKLSGMTIDKTIDLEKEFNIFSLIYYLILLQYHLFHMEEIL